jgi:hypothetical protein
LVTEKFFFRLSKKPSVSARESVATTRYNKLIGPETRATIMEFRNMAFRQGLFT